MLGILEGYFAPELVMFKSKCLQFWSREVTLFNDAACSATRSMTFAHGCCISTQATSVGSRGPLGEAYLISPRGNSGT